MAGHGVSYSLLRKEEPRKPGREVAADKSLNGHWLGGSTPSDTLDYLRVDHKAAHLVLKHICGTVYE
jgi:hypothetical protein